MGNRLCLIRDVINTCDDTIHNLDAHKILYPILSLKLGVTSFERAPGLKYM